LTNPPSERNSDYRIHCGDVVMDDLQTIIRRNEQMTKEQEHKVIACLKRAGLCKFFADRIIDSEGNALARQIVELINSADPMRFRFGPQPGV
jgi:hypothetical protein